MSLPPIHNETRMLEGLKTGNEKAFEAIYYTYGPNIYINILKMVKDAPVAQELLQDVFVKLWEKRGTINITTSLAAYLYRMSANRVADYFNSIAGNKTVLMEIIHSAGNYNPVQDAIDFKEVNQLIEDAKIALPARRREVFTLCKLEGKSYYEVSQLLGVSIGTVNDHMVKAIKFMRGMLPDL